MSWEIRQVLREQGRRLSEMELGLAQHGSYIEQLRQALIQYQSYTAELERQLAKSESKNRELEQQLKEYLFNIERMEKINSQLNESLRFYETAIRQLGGALVDYGARHSDPIILKLGFRLSKHKLSNIFEI